MPGRRRGCFGSLAIPASARPAAMAAATCRCPVTWVSSASWLAIQASDISRSSRLRASAPGSRLASRSPRSARSVTPEMPSARSGSSAPALPATNRTRSPHRRGAAARRPADVDSVPGPRRCVPATCTSPSAASASASRLGHGHQVNPTGGSSSPSGASRSGSAGSQPAATKVGRGGWMGRTVLVCRPRSLPVSATSPPAGEIRPGSPSRPAAAARRARRPPGRA